MSDRTLRGFNDSEGLDEVTDIRMGRDIAAGLRQK